MSVRIPASMDEADGALPVAAVHQSGWRLIDSAPVDGRRFIGLDLGRQYMALGYRNALGEFELVDFENQPMSVGFYPTHWAPYPALPGKPL